jgi:hypothetical protein
LPVLQATGKSDGQPDTTLVFEDGVIRPDTMTLELLEECPAEAKP